MLPISLFVCLLAFLLLMAVLALVVYQLMCLADLEFDYINLYDSAERINSVVIPEFILQGALSLLFLLFGHWMMFLFCAPNLYYNVKQYRQNRHILDVTEIFNMLNREKKIRIIKLTYYFLLIFFSLFWLIWNILE
ncbi:ER-derived vesicles protein ERV14 [Zostera marina]|uniref:ER-derived vesicles protein ERV14 n=1 Tax=Zostera marina TaxID=29655 RepID=A0A0K9P4B2_ZOSMR|nr:ER-derived vesicles protein ERV14 [Zostera marina]